MTSTKKKQTVYKEGLIERVAEKTGLPKTTTQMVVDNFLRCIVDSVATGETVVLVGFATMERKVRAKRIGRNPQTKQAMEIPASVVPVLRAGKAFKDAVALQKEELVLEV